MARGSSITARDLECMLCDETIEPQALPLSLLEEITHGFSDEQKIGTGGFAVVYKGMLENMTVAVKRMFNTYMYEKEFQREVECLMIVKHKNVVRFLGYCADTQGTMARHEEKFVMADVQQRLLCFEYLPKGSLHEYIMDTSHELRWRDRYKIITGICQGLHYLHQKNILHLDLKPANILLDDEWVPKITDFGISRCFDQMQSQVITKIAGTPGYLAPESFNHTEVTYRNSYRLDIYSLGIVIMEILTGHKGFQALDKVVERWSDMLEESQSEVQLEQVRVCTEIGLECTNFDPSKRPNTQDIITRLDETNRMYEYVETDMITSQQQYVVFTVRNEQGFGLKQLRYLNNLQGSLEIGGLENVTHTEEALAANLAAKKQLRELELRWDFLFRTCDRAVETEVLTGLRPPMGLKKLKIHDYRGFRYPDWMVSKGKGGPKNLEEFELFTCGEGPVPQIVEAFPHLRVLSLRGGSWDALPSNMELLTSLKELNILSCENIRSLPALPESLEQFNLDTCNREFMKSCQTVGDPNWKRIEHVAYKTIDGKLASGRLVTKILSGVNRLRGLWHRNTE